MLLRTGRLGIALARLARFVFAAVEATDITGDATTAQAQSATGTGTLAFSGTASTAQAQSATGTGALEFSGAVSTAQAQSVSASNIGHVGVGTTGQAQSTAANGIIAILPLQSWRVARATGGLLTWYIKGRPTWRITARRPEAWGNLPRRLVWYLKARLLTSTTAHG